MSVSQAGLEVGGENFETNQVAIARSLIEGNRVAQVARRGR